jgi:hypothetical protein
LVVPLQAGYTMNKPAPRHVAFAFVVLAIPACVGNAQRSVRVPRPSVPMASGQPGDTRAELLAGFSSATEIVAPSVGDTSQAVEIPGTQLRGEFRFRPTKSTFIGVVHDRGIEATSNMPDATQAPVGDGDVLGYGITAGGSIATSSPQWRVGVAVEAMVWDVPYVEYQSFSDGFTNIVHGDDLVSTLGVGVTPTYKQGPVTLFGGGFVRNHPTTERKSIGSVLDGSGDIRRGPLNLLVHAGVEYLISPELSGTVIVNQDLTANPVQYGPGLQLALTAKFGSM